MSALIAAILRKQLPIAEELYKELAHSGTSGWFDKKQGLGKPFEQKHPLITAALDINYTNKTVKFKPGKEANAALWHLANAYLKGHTATKPSEAISINPHKAAIIFALITANPYAVDSDQNYMQQAYDALKKLYQDKAPLADQRAGKHGESMFNLIAREEADYLLRMQQAAAAAAGSSTASSTPLTSVRTTSGTPAEPAGITPPQESKELKNTQPSRRNSVSSATPVFTTAGINSPFPSQRPIGPSPLLRRATSTFVATQSDGATLEIEFEVGASPQLTTKGTVMDARSKTSSPITTPPITSTTPLTTTPEDEFTGAAATASAPNRRASEPNVNASAVTRPGTPLPVQTPPVALTRVFTPGQATVVESKEKEVAVVKPISVGYSHTTTSTSSRLMQAAMQGSTPRATTIEPVSVLKPTAPDRVATPDAATAAAVNTLTTAPAAILAAARQLAGMPPASTTETERSVSHISIKLQAPRAPSPTFLLNEEESSPTVSPTGSPKSSLTASTMHTSKNLFETIDIKADSKNTVIKDTVITTKDGKKHLTLSPNVQALLHQLEAIASAHTAPKDNERVERICNLQLPAFKAAVKNLTYNELTQLSDYMQLVQDNALAKHPFHEIRTERGIMKLLGNDNTEIWQRLRRTVKHHLLAKTIADAKAPSPTTALAPAEASELFYIPQQRFNELEARLGQHTGRSLTMFGKTDGNKFLHEHFRSLTPAIDETPEPTKRSGTSLTR